MSDNKEIKKHRKVGLYPKLSANRHLNPRQFGTSVTPKNKVINHLDWDPASGHIKHVVEYVSEWQ